MPSTPINASKAAFACQDVRLKNGFPPKVVVKNSLVIHMRSSDAKAFRMDSHNLSEILGSLGCGAGGLKFYSQSKSYENQNQKVKILIFECESLAYRVQKSIQGISSAKSVLLTESELGYDSAPVLSHSEMTVIMANNMHKKNIMKLFDGEVLQDISFKFKSHAGLNLFLLNFGGSDKSSLGLFRKSQEMLGKNTNVAVSKVTVLHSVSQNRPLWKSGWHWPQLAEICSFEIERSSATKSTKVLVFGNTFSLFKFLAGPTAKVLTEVKVENLLLPVPEVAVYKEVGNSTDAEFCVNHPHHKKDYWCKEDSLLVCEECLIFGEHRGHTAVIGEDRAGSGIAKPRPL